jgi:hypothetical protein
MSWAGCSRWMGSCLSICSLEAIECTLWMWNRGGMCAMHGAGFERETKGVQIWFRTKSRISVRNKAEPTLRFVFQFGMSISANLFLRSRNQTKEAIFLF